MEVNPLSVILVKSDSKGDRLLFRYPYNKLVKDEPVNIYQKNPYSLRDSEDILQAPPPPISNIYKSRLVGFSDEVLSTLFAVKPDLCNRKFELKVNDVRFVGHPTLLPYQGNAQEDVCQLLINIVFALQALASHSVVKCYHDLSKSLGIALRHEEQRCGYVSEQTQLMAATHDDHPETAFQDILTKCSLASNLKDVYDNLCSTGIVDIRINRWIPVSFCLPQKVHQWHLRGRIIEPEDINRCIKAMRPYHGLLLLTPVQQLHDIMPLDGSPSLKRLLSMYSPLKSLQTLAADADITLSHVFELTAHLVYWGKATVIYPLCATNKYVIAPDAPIHLNCPLIDKFSEQFPGASLVRVVSDFSLPTSLAQKFNPLTQQSQQSQLIQMMIWMLQHHLLVQLHTYVQFIGSDSEFKLTSADCSLKSEVTRLSASGHESESGASNNTPEPHSHGSDIYVHLQSDDNDTSLVSVDDVKHEELLLDFSDEDRAAIFNISAARNPEDLSLLARLYRKGYFQGEHHLEEIMYLENLRRSQLLQLLDKFRDVLITYETVDPAIAMFSSTP